jgi:nucleoside-diphosphate-sugar epimerase
VEKAQETMMDALTIFGGHGFVGTAYTKQFYDAAIGNIVSVNRRDDHKIYSEDVLYLLSTVHNYHIFNDPHLDINTNLNTLVTILENWKEYQEKQGKKGVFNFISSWSVYGNQGLDVKETSQCDPHGWYIITKRCAEQLLVEYCDTFGLQYRILRLGNVVGLGDKKVSEKKNVLQHNINLLKNNKNVELYGTGRFYRDFIHIEDVVRAIELVMCKGNVNEVYNIGNGKPANYYIDLLRYIKGQLDSTGDILLKEPTEFQKKVPVQSFYMDNTKLKNLGYVPEYLGNKLYDSLIKG